MTEALLILAAAIFIIAKSIKKLTEGPAEIEQLGAGAAVMALSVVANLLVSNHLLRVARQTDSPALEGDAMHLRTDVYTSAGVLAGLVAIKVTGLRLLDPLFALGVAMLIVNTSYRLIAASFHQIVDARLPDEEEDAIHQVMAAHTGQFREYHKLRTRKSGNVRHIDMHLVVHKTMTVEAGHTFTHALTREIADRLPNSQVLVHVEPCHGNCATCTIQDSAKKRHDTEHAVPLPQEGVSNGEDA